MGMLADASANFFSVHMREIVGRFYEVGFPKLLGFRPGNLLEQQPHDASTIDCESRVLGLWKRSKVL
jgi:hypothetical protein